MRLEALQSPPPLTDATSPSQGPRLVTTVEPLDRPNMTAIDTLQSQLKRAVSASKLASTSSSKGLADTSIGLDDRNRYSGEGAIQDIQSARRRASFDIEVGPSKRLLPLPRPARSSSTPKKLRRPTSAGEVSSWASKLTTLPFPTGSSSRGSKPSSSTSSPVLDGEHFGSSPTTLSPEWANRIYDFDVKPLSTTAPRPPPKVSTESLAERRIHDSLSSALAPIPNLTRPTYLPLSSITDLPSIVGSPAASPPITRSWSSPPMLPSLNAAEPISPIELTFTQPSSASSKSSWRTAETNHPLGLYAMPEHSSSAPHLSPSASMLASSPPKPSSSSESTNLTKFDNGVLLDSSSRDAKNEKRYHSFLELVETEAGYLEHLRTLVKIYFRTLPFLTVLSVDEIRTVIRNGEALLELHERIGAKIDQVNQELQWKGNGFISDREQASRVRKAAARISRIFLDELPQFSLYNNFCAKHNEAIEIIRSIEHRPEWEVFERQCTLLSSAPVSPLAGDRTPIAATTSTAFHFLTFAESSSAASSYFPIGTSASRTSQPLTKTLSASRSKLRFADYAITPVQRVCRYPLVFGQLLKTLSVDVERDVVKTAWEGLRSVAEAVDAAQRARAGEIRTRIVAARMEFLAPANAAFCDVLGPTLLVGSLHVLHRTPIPDAFRVKYYGCFLYRSHLIIGKIKKRDSYEPREWLPLRLFTIQNVEAGEGALPCSIRLSHRDHIFELAATCEEEKAIWYDQLVQAKKEAHRIWDSQKLDASGQTTLFDETVVSSLVPTTPSNVVTPRRRTHSRTNSAVSLKLLHDRSTSAPASADSNVTFETMMSSFPANVSLSPTVSRGSRFSSTASALLGKNLTAQHAGIDLRLSDVFSEELTQARAHAGRMRTQVGGPRRSLTGQAITSRPATAIEARRMSSVDVLQSAEYKGAAIGYNVGDAVLYAQPPTPESRRWSTTLRKTKSNGAKTPKLVLMDIDTRVPASSAPSWSDKTVRRASSHSSLTGMSCASPISPDSIITPTLSTSAFASSAEPPSTVDVARQNSVSSSNSGTNSSSSHGFASHTGSLSSTETPPSSIPPSPDYRDCLDLADLHAKLPSPSATIHTNAQSSRWSTQAQHFGDSMTSAFKIRRRGSTLGLSGTFESGLEHSGERPSIEIISSQGLGSSRSGTSNLQRRASAASQKLGGFFTKRVQSSPSLVQFFASPSSTAVVSSDRSYTGMSSKSATHLTLPSSTETLQPLSAVSSRSSGSTPPGSGACSPISNSALPPRNSSKSSASTAVQQGTSQMDFASTANSQSRNRSMRSLFQSQYRLTPMS